MAPSAIVVPYTLRMQVEARVRVRLKEAALVGNQTDYQLLMTGAQSRQLPQGLRAIIPDC